jgi:hypothetical protein
MRSDLVRLKRDTDTGQAAAFSSGTVAVVQHEALQSGAQQAVPTWGSRVFLYSAVVSGVVIALIASAMYLRLKSPEPPSVKRIDQLTNDGALKASVLTGDGFRVFFTEETTEGWRIAQVPTTREKYKKT